MRARSLGAGEASYPRCIWQYHSSITVDELVEIAKHHLDAMYKYQTELGNALAAANRQGEENRRQERQRIWGYS
jgi:hypothetical protein